MNNSSGIKQKSATKINSKDKLTNSKLSEPNSGKNRGSLTQPENNENSANYKTFSNYISGQEKIISQFFPDSDSLAKGI